MPVEGECRICLRTVGTGRDVARSGIISKVGRLSFVGNNSFVQVSCQIYRPTESRNLKNPKRVLVCSNRRSLGKESRRNSGSSVICDTKDNYVVISLIRDELEIESRG